MPVNVVKPSANSSSGTSRAFWNSGSSAYDFAAGNDLTTGAVGTLTIPVNIAGTYGRTLTLSSIPALPAQSYTSKKLFVNWGVTSINDPGGMLPRLLVEYTVDGGTWVTAEEATSVSSGQFSYEMGGSQDETVVKVRATVDATSDSSADVNMGVKIFDVWIEGTYGVVTTAGKKAAAMCAS